MIFYNDLVEGFLKLGLSKGDTVMVHSSFKSFGNVDGGPQTVINALLETLGKNGTLVMPTYTLNFCKEYNQNGSGFFDLNNTPSEMGILSEFLRKMPNSKRSLNPIHSVAVHGKLTDYLTKQEDKNSYSEKSIFAKLHKLNAKLMIIGLTYQQSLTFFHYVEQMIPVDYRSFKKFSGKIVVDGKESTDDYLLFVKNIKNRKKIMANYDPLGDVLEKKGIVNHNKIGDSDIKLLTCNDVFKISKETLEKNPKLVYWIENQ